MMKLRLLALLLSFAAFALVSGRAQTADNSSPTKVTGKGKLTASGLQYWDITMGTGTAASSGTRNGKGELHGLADQRQVVR